MTLISVPFSNVPFGSEFEYFIGADRHIATKTGFGTYQHISGARGYGSGGWSVYVAFIGPLLEMGIVSPIPQTAFELTPFETPDVPAAECGCDLDETFPGSGVAADGDDQSVEVCTECQQCMDCCDCSVCESCDARHASNGDSYVCSICNRCEEGCCYCWYCEDCEDRHSDDTAQCRACNNCLNSNHHQDNCFFCESHNRWEDSSDGYCGGCDSCYDRCECPSDEDSSSDDYYSVRLRSRPLTFLTCETYAVNPLTRCISLEIETQGARSTTTTLNTALDTYATSVVTDGSLNDSGWELNTQPANGDTFERLVTETSAGLVAADCEIDTRCGVHVHVDARDITTKELRKVIALYQRVEPMMYALSGNRSDSEYCKPCGKYYGYWIHDPKQARSRLLSKLYLNRDTGVTKKDGSYGRYGRKGIVLGGMDNKYNPARYHALNVHSYYLRGTIEFRHHKGTIERERLYNWSIVCGSLVEYAKTHTYDEIMSLPLDASDAVKAITPETLHAWIDGRVRYVRADFWKTATYHHETAKRDALEVQERQRVIKQSERDYLAALNAQREIIASQNRQSRNG